jgi:IstB-like ATP binding protein
MRHNPASGAIVIMLRSLKMHGMAQAVGELTEQGAPAFEAAIPILSQLLKAETAEREVRSTAYQLKTARFPGIAISTALTSPRLSACRASSITTSASASSRRSSL